MGCGSLEKRWGETGQLQTWLRGQGGSCVLSTPERALGRDWCNSPTHSQSFGGAWTLLKASCNPSCPVRLVNQGPHVLLRGQSSPSQRPHTYTFPANVPPNPPAYQGRAESQKGKRSMTDGTPRNSIVTLCDTLSSPRVLVRDGTGNRSTCALLPPNGHPILAAQDWTCLHSQN